MLTSEQEFTVEVRREAASVVVAPRGEIDLATVGRVREALRAHEHGALVLDLAGVDFLDSSGLTLIIEQQRRSEQDGFRFAVGRGPAAVERLFEVTGLAHRLTFHDPSAGESG